MTSANPALPAGNPHRSGPVHRAKPAVPQAQRIPAAFQIGLVLYIIFTGDFPTVIQALAFGMKGSGGTEFAAAMVASAARDLLFLAPVMILSRHPLGILHPLLLAVVVWPLAIGIPKVIEIWGGWAGVLAGVPLDTPFYRGFPTHEASRIWTAIAKYNALQCVSLVGTYVGFWVLSGRRLARLPIVPKNTMTLRTVLIALFAVSMLVLVLFLYYRGGIGLHLTSLGHGRFRELAGLGPIVGMTDIGAIAVYVWIAARPNDAKSPIFLTCLALVTATQFVSNGSRGSALTVLLVVAIIWSLRQRRIPWKIGFILLPLMFASIGLLGAARTAAWSNSTAGEALSNTGWGESVQLAQEEIADRQESSANIPVIEQGFAVTDGPMYGKTYLPAVAAWVPRALWPDKPRGTGSIYSQLFLHESSEGAGIPVSAQAEMYWNFGWPGVILLSIIYGGLLKMAYNFMWRRYPDPFAITFYVIFLTNFQFATRSLIAFQQQAGLLFFSYVFASFILGKSTKAVPIGVPSLSRRPAPLAS